MISLKGHHPPQPGLDQIISLFLLPPSHAVGQGKGQQGGGWIMPVKTRCEMMVKEQKHTTIPCCRLQYPNLVGTVPSATVLALAAAKVELQGGQKLILQRTGKHLLVLLCAPRALKLRTPALGSAAELEQAVSGGTRGPRGLPPPWHRALREEPHPQETLAGAGCAGCCAAPSLASCCAGNVELWHHTKPRGNLRG